MTFEFSHLAIPVSDMVTMRRFYTETLGFIVTDQGGEDPGDAVFLSSRPGEHHQVVLANSGGTTETDTVLGHFALRVDSLTELRGLYKKLTKAKVAELRTVSHGTTWSVYFRDPENTRIEILTDTPWHVAQPCRFEIDLGLPDDKLIEKTEAHARTLPGFRPKEDWSGDHAARLQGA
jgi:catechol 2,3-dioxygenase